MDASRRNLLHCAIECRRRKNLRIQLQQRRLQSRRGESIKVHWYKVGDEDGVAGAIASLFSQRGSTFQRINQITEEYSKLVFEKVSGGNFAGIKKLGKTPDNFFRLLHSYDLEDLLCMWLFSKHGYICIPSTNKIGTPKYECVLRDPKSGNNIYIQSKHNSDIDAKNYYDLPGEVYLCSALRRVTGLDPVNHPNIKSVSPQELFDFVLDPSNKNLIPKRIFDFLNLL